MIIVDSGKKAIITRYLGPTDTKGSRIKASDLDGNSKTISYECALSSFDNHAAAAKALCIKKSWNYNESMICGSIPRGYAFVFTGK